MTLVEERGATTFAVSLSGPGDEAPPADAARAIGASAWAGGVRKAKEMNKLLPALAPRTPS